MQRALPSDLLRSSVRQIRCPHICSAISWRLLLIFLATILEDANATVTMAQGDREVIVGGTTWMSCVTALPKEIYWFHFPAGGSTSDQKDVYAYGKMHPPYKDRFLIQINRTTGFYQLVIPRVELTDAGVYSCQEDEGSGHSKQANLTVLESGPVCTSTKNPIELIGPNSCGKAQENLTLACSVSYRGSISVSPQLEWKIVGADNIITEGLNVVTTGNRVTFLLTMSSHPSIDGSSFLCQTSKTAYNCTSDVINVIYAISSNVTKQASIGDTVVCTANTNESCSYKWKWFKGDDVLTASNNRTLIPKQSGNFRCEAECFIRKEPCTITAMFAYVEDGNGTSTIEDVEHGSSHAAAIAIAVVVALFVVIIVVIILFRKQYQKNLRNRAKESLLMKEYNGVIQDVYDIPTHFTKMPFINKGHSGEIYGPFDFRDIRCACERIMFTPTKEEGDVCARGRRWMTLENRNVLKFYEVFFKSPALYIVMDYAQGGSVRKALNSWNEDLAVNVVKDWATQIASGMNYLHEKDIVHHGLKAAQILIMKPFSSTNPSPNTLKISPYRLTKDSGQSVGVTFQGMFGWMAPEAIRGESTGKASDVWSYGVTIWEILTKSIPHKDVKQSVIIKELSSSEGSLTLSVPSRCPDAIRNILNECWDPDQDSRPTFSDVLSRLQAVADC